MDDNATWIVENVQEDFAQYPKDRDRVSKFRLDDYGYGAFTFYLDMEKEVPLDSVDVQFEFYENIFHIWATKKKSGDVAEQLVWQWFADRTVIGSGHDTKDQLVDMLERKVRGLKEIGVLTYI